MSNIFNSFDQSANRAFVESRLRARDYVKRGYIYGGETPSMGWIRNTSEYQYPEDVWTIRPNTHRNQAVLGPQTSPSLNTGGYSMSQGNKFFEIEVYCLGADVWYFRTENREGQGDGRAAWFVDFSDNKIYVFDYLNERMLNNRFDSVANSWTKKNGDDLVLRWWMVGASIDGKGYVYGGVILDLPNEPLNMTDVNQEYDPLTDAWSDRLEIPEIEGGMTGGNLDGEAYYCGGVTKDEKALARARSYNPIANTWRSRPDMPHSRLDHANFILERANNSIFVTGGTLEQHNEDLSSDVTMQFKADTNSWTIQTPHPAKRRAHGSFAI